MAPVKNRHFLRFIHNTNNNNYHFHHQQLLQRRVFSEYTEAVTTSLIPIDAILPEIFSFIVGFSCTAWTKMRSLRAHYPARTCGSRGYMIGSGVHIYYKYSTLSHGISADIAPKVGIFSEAGGRGKYSLPRVQYLPEFHKG